MKYCFGPANGRVPACAAPPHATTRSCRRAHFHHHLCAMPTMRYGRHPRSRTHAVGAGLILPPSGFARACGGRARGGGGFEQRGGGYGGGGGRAPPRATRDVAEAVRGFVWSLSWSLKRRPVGVWALSTRARSLSGPLLHPPPPWRPPRALRFKMAREGGRWAAHHSFGATTRPRPLITAARFVKNTRKIRAKQFPIKN